MAANIRALKEFSTELLEEELEIRKRLSEQPKPLSDPDFSRVIDYITESIQDLVAGERVKDFRQMIWEEAMKAVYGPNIFSWYNKQNFRTD